MKTILRPGQGAAILTVAVAFLVGIYAYPLLPARVASHWNAAGAVNGYMSVGWGAFLVPCIMALLLVVFAVARRIDPKRENIAQFGSTYDWFVEGVLLFLLYLYFLTLALNVGVQLAITQWISLGFGGLIIAVGATLKRAQPNWTLGIRTPWTLSDETVWRRTHAAAGSWFELSGVIALVGFLLPAGAFALVLAPVLISAIAAVVYSYVLYRCTPHGRAR